MPITYHECSDTYIWAKKMEKEHEILRNLLRKMKKRYYETFEYICKKETAHYSKILKYDLGNGIVKSRATVTLIVRSLSKMNLIKRTIIDSRPIRTVYQPTQKGLKLLQHLREIERL
jgi:DNA-binding HxlR family transcriptional regulator